VVPRGRQKERAMLTVLIIIVVIAFGGLWLRRRHL
jgi:hypothetical protein